MGAVEYLPFFIGMMILPIIFDALDHHYYQAFKLGIVAVGIFIGITLLPARRSGKRPSAVMYLPAVISITVPSILFAVLERSYDKIPDFLVLALVLIGIGLLPIKSAGKPTIAIENDVLTVRMRLYIPAKTEKISLAGLSRVTIAGPRGNRDWIFLSKDGIKRDIRPNLGDAMDEAFASLLKSAADGRFAVVIQKPYDLEP